MAEWLKTQHWKCCEVNSLRGFESHPFLHVGAKFALLRFSLQKNIRPLPCSSFFAKAHVHVGYSVASALITPLALYLTVFLFYKRSAKAHKGKSVSDKRRIFKKLIPARFRNRYIA